MEKISYSVQDFASALVAYIGRKVQGSFYAPFRIVSSSLHLDPATVIRIDLDRANGHRKKSLHPSRTDILPAGKSLHQLDREEVMEALSFQIEICRLRRKPTGKLVKEIPVDLPNKVMVELEYVQSGSQNGNSISRFDGKLQV